MKEQGDQMQANIPRGTVYLTISEVFQYVFFLIFYMVLTKTNTLSQADIGTLSVLTFLVSLFSLLTFVSLPTALVKYVSEFMDQNKKSKAMATQNTIIKTVVILSSIGLLIGIIFSGLISDYFLNGTEYVYLIIINFVFAFFSNLIGLVKSALNGVCLFGRMALLTIIFVVITRVLAIVFASFNLGVMGVIVGYAVGTIVSFSISIFFLRGKIEKSDEKAPLKPLLAFSLPLTLSSIAGLVLNWADIIIITSLIRDLSLTGVYSIAINSAGALKVLYLSLTSTILPVLSAQQGIKDFKKVTNTIKTTSRYLLYLMLPSCIGLAIIAPRVLSFFYGPSYVEGAIPLAIVAITTIITALTAILSLTMTAIGKTSTHLKIKVTISILTLLSLIIFVPFFEIIGAAVSRLVIQVIAIILTAKLLQRDLKISFDKEAIWKSSLSTGLMVLILFTVEFMFGHLLSELLMIFLDISIAVVVYVFGLYVLNAIKKHDIELIRLAFPKSFNKFISLLERILVR